VQKIYQKRDFWGKNIWTLLDTRVINLFEISALLLIPFADNFKE
jgi:hypothetical protein